MTGATSMPVFSSRKNKGDVGPLIFCAYETHMVGTCPSHLAHPQFLDESSCIMRATGKTGCARVHKISRMPPMKALRPRGLMRFAGMCCVALFCHSLMSPSHSASSSQTASSSGPAKRWAQFELNQAEPMGDPQTGKPITLTIYLGGVTAGATPVVAICESVAFQSQTVTLEPDAES